jgi:HSP20 family protein
MTILRYEPWALVSRFHQQLDQALNTEAGSADAAKVSWIPRVDIHEEAERFVVVADVPGVEGKDIEITAEKGVLTVRGERGSEKKRDRKSVV